MSQSGPSPHLRWDELRCHDAIKTPYPLDWRPSRAHALALVFERIRQATGSKPIHVVSAYRTAAWNQLVGGSARSQHVQGRALDLRTPDHLTLGSFWAIVQEVARLTPSIGGLGVYDWGVHVDTRPHLDHLASWDLRAPQSVRA